MRLSNATIDEIKNRIDIVDVVGEFVKLKRVGQNYRGHSPFSDEKTPSFFVFPKNENFKDFSSGKQGDAITFIMEYDGLSYVDALLFLAKKYGVEVQEEDQTDEEIQEQNERDSLYIVLNFAKDFFKNTLWTSEEGKSIGLSYFKERGFSKETIEKFELGYSQDKWDALEKEANAKGYNLDLLEKAGLIVRKDDKHYDRFRGRVIFPIHNSTGKTIAFGARILKKSENQPKYLNSPETEVYHKSNILYGIFQARKAIRAKDNCYLVEGYTDVTSMHQAGVENVVASSGTSLTELQIKLIKRHTENITVLFDGDQAGIRASLRGIDMILEQGMNVRTLAFPDGEDPDSYSRKLGTLGFQEYLKDQSQDFISFKTRLLSENQANDPIQKANTINQIIASISLVPDPVKRAVYMKQTSDMLEMEEQVLYGELNKILIGKRQEERKKTDPETDADILQEKLPEKPKTVVDPVMLQEKETIRLLINYGFNEIEEQYSLFDHYQDELSDVSFSTPVFKEILEIFKENLDDGKIIDADFLIKNAPEHIKEIVIELVSSPYEISKNWERYKIFIPKEADMIHNSVYTNILRLKFHKIKKLIALNLESMKSEKDPEKITELQKISIELKKAEAEFAKPLGIVVS